MNFRLAKLSQNCAKSQMYRRNDAQVDIPWMGPARQDITAHAIGQQFLV